MLSSNDDASRTEQISPVGLAEAQRAGIATILRALRDELLEDDRRHREQFRGEKLRAMFRGIGYAVEKIACATQSGSESDLVMGSKGLDAVKTCVASLGEALARREQQVDAVEEIVAELEFPLAKLSQWFQRPTADDEAKAAHIFAVFLAKRMTELEQIAAEIDRDCAPDG